MKEEDSMALWLKMMGWRYIDDGVCIEYDDFVVSEYDSMYYDSVDELLTSLGVRKNVSYWIKDEYESTVFEDIEDAVEFEEDTSGVNYNANVKEDKK